MQTLTRNSAAKKLGVKDTHLIYWERQGRIKPDKIKVGNSVLIVYTPELIAKAKKLLSKRSGQKK